MSVLFLSVLFVGFNYLTLRCRRRLLCLDELERWDAATALKAEMFHGLRVDVEASSGVQGYMNYY